MTYYPAGFDFRSPARARFILIEAETRDDVVRFILGGDGVFTDVEGREWWGSSLISGTGHGFGLNGVAAPSSLSLAYFEDPASPSTLIEDLRVEGPDLVRDRPLRRYIQVFDTLDQMEAPVHAPRLESTLIMSHISWSEPSALVRSLTLHLENAFRVRGGAAKQVYNTQFHSAQLGLDNPSYEHIPVDARVERRLLA